LVSKAQIKEIRTLHLPKFRQIYNKFIAEGEKVCTEFIKSGKFPIDAIFITNASKEKYADLMIKYGLELELISEKEMSQLSALKTPSDILLILKMATSDLRIMNNPKVSAIYLDGVQDPGNTGTIIRLADWFGIDAVIRSTDTADFFNPKVVQSTMGSMANVHLITANLKDLKPFERKIFGTYMDGQSIHQTTIDENAILVMGNEGKGIRIENEQWISNKISIPGAVGRIAESLNVAIAAGIICAHWKV